MRKKLVLLLAGAMSLSILLSACESAGAETAPDPTDAPAAASTGLVETATDTPDSDVPARSAAVSAPTEEPSGEPFPEAENTDTPAVVSAAPAVADTPKPAVSTPAPAVNMPAPAAVDAPEPSAAPQPVAEPTPAPVPEATPESAPAAPKGDAQAFIGRSVSSLIAAIGQPLSRSYAPSCRGSGEDGELIYTGFPVYTYREGDTETVQDVM